MVAKPGRLRKRLSSARPAQPCEKSPLVLPRFADYCAVHVTIALAAACGALAVLVLACLAILFVRRGRPQDDRVALAVSELNERMEVMVREFTSALEEAREEGRRFRFLGEVASSIDLDEVLERTLEAAGGLPGVDAALVTVADGDGTPFVASVGLSTEEQAREPIPGPPDGRAARAVAVSYHYAEDEVGGGSFIYGGVAVPVPTEHAEIGSLAIFTRSASHRFLEEPVRELEELARRAGPAIENARRFREARQLADLDALTRLHNRRYFHETLQRECARAHRYDRRLSLIVFDLDDFKAVNDRIGHLPGDAVLAEVGERVRDVVRSADIACRVGGDEFAVILPESGVADAAQLSQRLQTAVSNRPIPGAGTLAISAGVAELLSDDDALSFFERADGALYRAKNDGKGRVVAASS